MYNCYTKNFITNENNTYKLLHPIIFCYLIQFISSFQLLSIDEMRNGTTHENSRLK